LASLRALLRAHLREDIEAARRPELPWVSPIAQRAASADPSVDQPGEGSRPKMSVGLCA